MWHSFYTTGQGGYGYSPNGLDWTLVSGYPNGEGPYSRSVNYTDGSSEVMTDIQRPKILFVDGKPAYLINGAGKQSMWTDSFTLFRAIQQ